MKSDAQRQAEYQARQTGKGKARLNCWIAGNTKKTITELTAQHGKTVTDIIDLGIAAAANLLAGRLLVARAAAQPGARVIIRSDSQKRPLAHDLTASNTNTPEPPENAPTGPQCEPAQIADDADARIRAAAFVVEP